jgi:RNA polymerase sigma factor (sigma-70 family)
MNEAHMNIDRSSHAVLGDDRPARLAACLTRAQAGDLRALDAVVEELNPLLWHVARSQGLTAEDASDVVQTTWLELVRQLHEIRSPLALTAWLVTTTKREAWHTSARRRKHSGPGVDFLQEVADDLPEPDEGLSAHEQYRALRRNFARLSERCRALLGVIARVDPPDYATIAEALGMPHGSIGPTRGRCLAKLRAMLLADPVWRVE